MTCADCTFCNEDILVLQDLMTDARARGNYRFANSLEKALRNCSNLQAKLKPADRAYLENIARIAKSDTWPSDEQTDLLMDAQQVIKIVKENSEPQQRTRPQESGFRGMVNAAFHVQSPETPEPEPQTPFGFLRMLDSNYQAHVTSGSDETHSRIPCGFGEMLESAFPNRPPVTLDDKPRARRGMGFRAMLEGASRGT